nr:oxysterol-binding protein-related protein 9-like isoform X3 [Cherax quadricarinatus]
MLNANSIAVYWVKIFFDFQAHDPDEREKWIRGLEDTIVRHTPSIRRWDPSKPAPTMADFDKKLIESDVYLQLLIEQTSVLEKHMLSTDDEADRQRCQDVITNVNTVLESIKHSIVLLQIAKNTAFPVNGVYHPCNAIPEGTSSASSSEGVVGGVPCALVPPDTVVPEMSYSSSEDEDFFDADDFTSTTPSQSPSGPRLFEVAVESIPGQSGISESASSVSSASNVTASQVPLLNPPDSSTSPGASGGSCSGGSTQSPSTPALPSHTHKASVCGASDKPFDTSEPSIDYDLMYEEDDDPELESMEGHGSVIHHLLSQVKIGMDLTKVVLPTFILERRSLLEMYADFFAHPDLFCSIADMTTPQDRMVQVVKWYLSAFHAGRKSEVARKPYNPILGEVFRCYWEVPGVNTKGVDIQDGPIPWAESNQLCFVAEQVSHHPPISAFYAEHKDKRISFCGHIWTKSKFLGLSVCVNNIGQGCVSLIDHDEEYILNFPSGYGRSILTVPWVELGGTCQITCNKTGYNASVEFLTKPFYGGKKHRISAEVFSPGEKKPILTVEGEWNGVMVSKLQDGESKIFVDTQSMGTVKKNVKSISQQAENESRFMWKDVTAGLKFNQIDQATAAKCALEQKQRDEAKYRKDNVIEWETKLFHLVGDNWIYKKPLLKRLTEKTEQ